MSVPTDSQSMLIESTPEQIQKAFTRAVHRSGFTVEQLQEQAAEGHFAISRRGGLGLRLAA